MTEPTRSLGKYQILEELGKGGFATVFRARDTDLDREVALKVLDPLLTRDPVWVERFRQEAKAIARLKHPRIITIHEIGQSEGVLYIATEMVEGGSLADHIAAQGRLSWEETVQLVGEIAEALGYAHSQGVLHRDMKPANVLLDPNTGAVLTDFGFARIVADHSLSVSMSGGVVGTPAYIAPEVWHGDKTTAQTDIYALACILYEMVTGSTLFTGATPPAVMLSHFQPPTLPDDWPEDVPADLTEVLDKALARESEQRYATTGEMAETLAVLNVDRLEDPYAALEQAIAEEDWQQALALIADIKATDPDYRDVAALKQKALAGIEEEAWKAKLVQLQNQTEQAIVAGDWQEALTVVDEIKTIDPDNETAVALEQNALSGMEEDARKQQGEQWNEAVETALAAGNLQAAELALAQWAGLGVEDKRIAAYRKRMEDEQAEADRQQREREKQEKAAQASLVVAESKKQATTKPASPTKTSQAPALKPSTKQDSSPWQKAPPAKSSDLTSSSVPKNDVIKETVKFQQEENQPETSGFKTVSIVVFCIICGLAILLIWQGYQTRTEAYNAAKTANFDRHYAAWTVEAEGTARYVALVKATETADAKAATATSRPATHTPVPILEPIIISTMSSPVDSMELVYVHEGEFLMGSPDSEGNDDEHPQHTVYLDSYWLDKNEVTNVQYQQCVAEGQCQRSRYAAVPRFNRPNHPVLGVSWHDASAYCEWVGRRLPTEAEWEKAARGIDDRIYPWGDAAPACSRVQYTFCDGDALEVGSMPMGASPYGALDMAGNVWEWVADWYDSDYYSSSPDTNPEGPVTGSYRVLRGGSWFGPQDYVRSSSRYGTPPESRNENNGFRCAVSEDPNGHLIPEKETPIVPTNTPTPQQNPPTDTPTRTKQPTKTFTPTKRPTQTPTPFPAALPKTNMNVRSGPGTNYPVTGAAEEGKDYRVTGKNSGGDWWRIDFDERSGWLSVSLTKFEGHINAVSVVQTPIPPEAAITPSVTTSQNISNASEIIIVNLYGHRNVYSGPGSDYAKIGVLNSYSQHRVTGRDITWDWLRIDFFGQDGWVTRSGKTVEGDMRTIPLVNTSSDVPLTEWLNNNNATNVESLVNCTVTGDGRVEWECTWNGEPIPWQHMRIDIVFCKGDKDFPYAAPPDCGRFVDAYMNGWKFYDCNAVSGDNVSNEAVFRNISCDSSEGLKAGIVFYKRDSGEELFFYGPYTFTYSATKR